MKKETKEQSKLMKSKENKLIIIGAGVGLIILLVLFFGLRSCDNKLDIAGTNKDITKYEEYLKDSAKGDSWTKYDMDESIWPAKITSDMKVKDYTMKYINIIDAQFVGYLEVQYDKENYKKEVDRLKKYKSTEYKGVYGVTGTKKEYDLLAIYTDGDYGFVYALTDNKDTVMYVEMIFSDYFLDINYKKIIPKDCILNGFDASENNSYRKIKLKELEDNFKEEN